MVYTTNDQVEEVLKYWVQENGFYKAIEKKSLKIDISVVN